MNDGMASLGAASKGKWAEQPINIIRPKSAWQRRQPPMDRRRDRPDQFGSRIPTDHPVPEIAPQGFAKTREMRLGSLSHSLLGHEPLDIGTAQLGYVDRVTRELLTQQRSDVSAVATACSLG